MKKLYRILGLCFCLSLLLGMTVFADGPEASVKVNDIIMTDSGREVVIDVLEDGRFITAPLSAETNAPACEHTDLIGTGKKVRETSSYNKTDSTYCYKYRDYEEARCARCGKTGFKIYDAGWTNVKHTYKLLGSTCTKCGYKK